MKMKKASGKEFRWIKKIYLEAFPKSERRPFGMMKRQVKQGTMEFLVTWENGKPVGFALTVLYQDRVLLDYFAIDRKFCGQNYGSEMMRLLKERYQDRRLILEIELPDDQASNHEQRIRRKRFYLKNGIQETGIHVGVFGVPMELLTDGKPLTYQEYHEIYEEVIGAFFARRVVQL